jgi:ABC-type transport system involved in multi-copper enzyme maturation permease subunit
MSVQAYQAPDSASRRSGTLADSLAAVFASYYWELRKLAAQKRSWAGLAAAAIVELVFLISIEISKVTPNDGPYADPMGHGLRHSGLALTPVVLKEIAYFGPAIIAALVGGDIVANEDGGGTLKTILVRSVRRGELLAAKALALFSYVVVALVVFAATGVVAGTIAWGFHPLANISGTRISAAHALGLTFAAIAVYVVPTIAIASFGPSSPSSPGKASPASSARSSTRSPWRDSPRCRRSKAHAPTSSSTNCTPGTAHSRHRQTGH